jgi:hypothetical protein
MADRRRKYVLGVGKPVPVISDPTQRTTHPDEESTHPDEESTHSDEEATHPDEKATQPDEEAIPPTTDPITAPRPPWPKNGRQGLPPAIANAGPPQSRNPDTGDLSVVNIEAGVSLSELPQIEKIT